MSPSSFLLITEDSGDAAGAPGQAASFGTEEMYGTYLSTSISIRWPVGSIRYGDLPAGQCKLNPSSMHNRPRLMMDGLCGRTANVLPSFKAGTSILSPSLTVIGPFTVDISHAGSRPTIFASNAREHSSKLAMLNAEPVSAMYRRGPLRVEAAHGLKKACTRLL